MPCTGWFDVR